MLRTDRESQVYAIAGVSRCWTVPMIWLFTSNGGRRRQIPLCRSIRWTLSLLPFSFRSGRARGRPPVQAVTRPRPMFRCRPHPNDSTPNTSCEHPW